MKGAECDAYSKPFRDIVQGDSQNQQHAFLPGGFYSFGVFHGKAGVQMRQYLIKDPEKCCTKQEAGRGR